MTLPKKLLEKRDELAHEHENYAWRAAPYTEVTIDSSFRTGFDSACDLLIPQIEKLREALKMYTDIYAPNNDYAKQALRSIEEFLNEK